jgi:transcriptional antiterminator RfaH
LKGWYLIHTKPRAERLAQANLDRQGFQVYLPLARSYRRRGGRRVATISALFPRYLFVLLDLRSDNAAPIRSTVGVSALVRFGSEPAQVPEDFMSALRNREGDDGVHEWVVGEIVPGARVRIAEGSFEGYEGVFLARSGRARVAVLLDLLGRSVRATVGAGQIEPAP